MPSLELRLSLSLELEGEGGAEGHSASRVLLAVGSRLSKADPLRSSARIYELPSLFMGAHFPELHSFMMGESIQWGEKRRGLKKKKKRRAVPLASIQQRWPLISAWTAHNDKGRQAGTHSERWPL